MANSSEVSIELNMESIPVFPCGRAVTQQGVVSSLAEDIWLFTETMVSGSLSLLDRLILADPQVSGGLLLHMSCREDERRWIGKRVPPD